MVSCIISAARKIARYREELQPLHDAVDIELAALASIRRSQAHSHDEYLAQWHRTQIAMADLEREHCRRFHDNGNPR